MVERLFSVKKSQRLYIAVILCILLGIIYANASNPIIVNGVGLAAGLLACCKICLFDFPNRYILLFGIQFFRSIIRFNIGTKSYSFLLVALPLFLFSYFRESKMQVSKNVLLPMLLLIWDIVISLISGIIAPGDQLLWGLSFVVLTIIVFDRTPVDLNKLIIVFGLSIWGILLVNISAELRQFGRTLVPSMYGTWNRLGEYYSFGKGYVDIGGGNEIAQYIPLFICMAFLTYQKQTKPVKLFYIASSAFFLYCGLLCISRAFYIEMGFVVLFWLVYMARRRRLHLFIPLAVLAVLLFATTLSDKVKPVWDAVLIRFSKGNAGRQQLITDTLATWRTNAFTFLFGIGTAYNDVYVTAHNIIADALISLGLLGMVFYYYHIGRCIMYVRWCRQGISILGYAPLVMMTVNKMVTGCVKDVPFYFIIGICLLFLREYTIEPGSGS